MAAHNGKPAAPPAPSADVRVALALFALLVGIYLFTASGHRYAIDEEQMYGLTQAVATRGSLALNAPAPDETPIYSTYGPGQSFAALPLYWLGASFSRLVAPEARPWLTGAITFWLNPLVTAATAALLYVGARRLGDRRAALAAALVYGLATTAWPHTKTFFAEPLNALLWLGALLVLWRPGRTRPGTAAFLVAGLLAGLAPAVKVQAVIALPLLGLYAAWVARSARQPWAALAGWALGAALPLLALAGYNAALFGAPLRTGYGGSVLDSFTTPFWEGFGGQLWGMRRGLIWYSPLLLLAPVGLVALWRSDRATAALCAALFAANVLFYATWYAWDGAGAWGPRFLNVALPFLCLPLAALRWSRPLSVAAVVLAALTVPAQVAGLSVNMNRLFQATPAPPSQLGAQFALVVEDAERAYERFFAPGRVVLLRGWSHSEGAGDALLPRWSLPDAVILVRSAAPAGLTLAVDGCYVAPAPTAPTLRVNGTDTGGPIACPRRLYRVLLPPGSSRIELAAPPWRPAAAGIEREGELGIYVTSLSAAGARALTLVGDRFPADPVPLGRHAMVRHLSDPRVATWDFWWSLMPLMPLGVGDARLVATVWGGLAALAALSGLLALFRLGSRFVDGERGPRSRGG